VYKKKLRRRGIFNYAYPPLCPKDSIRICPMGSLLLKWGRYIAILG